MAGDEEEDVNDPPDSEPTQGQQLSHSSSRLQFKKLMGFIQNTHSYLTQAESVKAQEPKQYRIE